MISTYNGILFCYKRECIIFLQTSILNEKSQAQKSTNVITILLEMKKWWKYIYGVKKRGFEIAYDSENLIGNTCKGNTWFDRNLSL